MGLDAVVYKNKENIKFIKGEEFAKIDETGEVYFEDSTFYDFYPKDYFEATSEYLGNIAEIASLREVFDDNSLISKFFINDVFGGGALLDVTNFNILEKELEEITKAEFYNKDENLQSFISKIINLLDEAKKQGNPIVLL